MPDPFRSEGFSLPDIQGILEQYMCAAALPEYGQLVSLIESGISVLDGESASYRERDSSGKPGGLIDFSSAECADIPVVVVPDLHGRGKLILDILSFKIGGRSVCELLADGAVFVCCMGDLFHSERRGRGRWISAFEECMRGNLVNEFLAEEMRENLSLLEMVLVLKSAFPGHFHVLKGNHENIMNEELRSPYGNVPFRKFCDEGNMVCDFVRSYYDDLVLHEIDCFEKRLPVCAVFRQCAVSHAEPLELYERRQIVNYHEPGSSVVFGLTWTGNGEAAEGSAAYLLSRLLPRQYAENAVYFTGHRPISGTFALRQNGTVVQIHNPERESIALALPGEKCNPEKSIIDIEERRNAVL